MDVDERFSHIQRDPRFKKIPSRKRKVKIDSRFRRMFTDKDFNTKYFVDKRGRKVKESASEDLTSFYKLSDEDEEDNEEDKSEEIEKFKTIDEPSVEVSEEEVEEDKIEKEKRRSTSKDKRKRSRKTEENLEGEEDDVTEEQETSFASDNDKSNDRNTVENWRESGAEAPTTEDATSRLAVCNMDWDKITADDLFVLFHSFLPSGRSIHSVKIHPSDYGLERMKTEDEVGPTELASTGNVSDDEDKNAEYDQEKLRQYQLNRLKYYYAVVECDCAATAEKIYEECDGMEYEASSSQVDLRFIPEDMTFEREPTSQATVLPSAETYKPPEFITTALQQSTVRLTWDETDPKRVQTTMRNFSKDDLLDMDFKAYLASSSSEDESEVEDGDENKKDNQDVKIEKYKALLEEIHKKDHESENEMEVTWDVRLKETTEELVERKKSEKQQKKLTPWESYLNEKKNKKRRKKQLKENNNESEPSTQISDDELPADVDLNDPFFATELEGPHMERKVDDSGKKRKRKGQLEESEEDKRRKAELQLLMMEEDDGRKHFNLKSIMKNEKSKRKKKKNKLEEPVKDDFEIDVNDSRFSALYSSHHYALDPSDPQFKKTKAMDSIVREKQRRSETFKEGSVKKEKDEAAVIKDISDKKRTTDSSLSVLIKNIKSNAGKYQDRRNKHARRK